MDNDLGLLIGKVLQELQISGDRVLFGCEDGSYFEAYHMQDCCENVSVHDYSSDVQNLIGQEILDAVETTSHEWPDDVKPPESAWPEDSFTWTYHIFRTAKGEYQIRWYGESNGYYSESVYFQRTHKPIDFGGGQ